MTNKENIQRIRERAGDLFCHELEGFGIDLDYFTPMGRQNADVFLDSLFSELSKLGVVVLADDGGFESIDIPDAVFFSPEAKRTGFTKRSFRVAGWRKVKKLV